MLVSTALERDILSVCGAKSFDAVFLADPDGADTSVGLKGDEGAARSLAMSGTVCSCCVSRLIVLAETLTTGGSLTTARVEAMLRDG